MPTIGNLHGLGCRPRCSLADTTAVARDDADCGGLAVWERVDDASPLEVADDAPVTLSALPHPMSMPMTRKGERSRVACRRTTRSKVSLLTGNISRRASAAAGRPPKA